MKPYRTVAMWLAPLMTLVSLSASAGSVVYEDLVTQDLCVNSIMRARSALDETIYNLGAFTKTLIAAPLTLPALFYYEAKRAGLLAMSETIIYAHYCVEGKYCRESHLVDLARELQSTPEVIAPILADESASGRLCSPDILDHDQVVERLASLLAASKL